MDWHKHAGEIALLAWGVGMYPAYRFSLAYLHDPPFTRGKRRSAVLLCLGWPTLTAIFTVACLAYWVEHTIRNTCIVKTIDAYFEDPTPLRKERK